MRWQVWLRYSGYDIVIRNGRLHIYGFFTAQIAPTTQHQVERKKVLVHLPCTKHRFEKSPRYNASRTASSGIDNTIPCSTFTILLHT